MSERSCVVVMSGGQDSMTCLFWARERFDTVLAVSFDYGQRHLVELEAARSVCAQYGVPWEVVTLPLAQLAPHNALTSPAIAVSETGGLNGLPSTFVPGRNLLMLTAAASYAASRGVSALVTGVCETDSSGYPDCRAPTIRALCESIALGLDAPFEIHTPLMELDKAQTFALAEEMGVLDVILELSHTCYEGDHSTRHAWGYGCAACPACKLRQRGFELFKGEGDA